MAFYQIPMKDLLDAIKNARTYHQDARDARARAWERMRNGGPRWEVLEGRPKVPNTGVGWKEQQRAERSSLYDLRQRKDGVWVVAS